MGPKPRTPPTKLSLLFLLAILVPSSRALDNQLKETNMTLYFQDFVGGPNATVAIVTGIPGKVWSFFSFGTIFVTDDKITAGPDRNSPEVGRGQGIYATSSLDGANTHVLFSIVFTSKEYNGSTLEIQERSIQLASVRESSVVGGTGNFRLAKGIATFETIYYDATIFYSVIRCKCATFPCYTLKDKMQV